MNTILDTPEPRGTVICLCADWCGTCRDYRATFEAVAQNQSDLDFQWLDVEDDANRYPTLDNLEVENFPTLLFAHRHQVLFYGTVLPHQATLVRLLEAYFPSQGAISATVAPTHFSQTLVCELQALLCELALTRQNGQANGEA